MNLGDLNSKINLPVFFAALRQVNCHEIDEVDLDLSFLLDV